MFQSLTQGAGMVLSWLLSPGGIVLVILAVLMWAFAGRKPPPHNPDESEP